MKRINGILIILVILIFNILSVIACNNKEIDNNYSPESILNGYSFDKVLEVNSLENLKKETGYFRFSIRSVDNTLNPCICYAYDKYLIFNVIDTNITIVTDKSSAYIIEDNKIKEHRKLNNYNQDSFIIDKSMHNTDIETSVYDGRIFQKFLSSENSAHEKLKYLDENFPEIFHFKEHNFPGVITSYYINPNKYDLAGYNILGSVPDSEAGTLVIYMYGNTKKDIDEKEKNDIKNLISLVNSYSD